VSDNKSSVGFEVLTAVSMKMAVFWVVAPCSSVPINDVNIFALHHIQKITDAQAVLGLLYDE
jgi:hypothetical protein